MCFLSLPSYFNPPRGSACTAIGCAWGAHTARVQGNQPPPFVIGSYKYFAPPDKAPLPVWVRTTLDDLNRQLVLDENAWQAALGAKQVRINLLLLVVCGVLAFSRLLLSSWLLAPLPCACVYAYIL